MQLELELEIPVGVGHTTSTSTELPTADTVQTNLNWQECYAGMTRRCADY